MIERFQGEDGKKLLAETLLSHRLLMGEAVVARELADRAELVAIKKGDVLIEQGGSDNDVYLVASGLFEVLVNGRRVAFRGPREHIGEMAAIEPSMKRSAAVVAVEDSVVLKVSAAVFAELGNGHPVLYRTIAQELSKRLVERNRLVNAYREKIRVFIMSSVEGLEIAQSIQTAFDHDPFIVTVWTDGVFRAGAYTMQSLAKVVDDSDFGIAIAHADDMTESRGKEWPSPRDNVVFELGLFMGRLGIDRAILMEPREETLKLPSDLTGITTIAYRFEKGEDTAALLGPACNRLREHIKRLGPYNG